MITPGDPKWRRYLRFWRRDSAADVDDELRFHFANRVAEFEAAGLSSADAIAAARARFGDLDAVLDDLVAIDSRISRRSRTSQFLDAMLHDIGYAIRGLRRSPGLAASIVLTLAFGIGANSAMFTVVDRVFFQPPPAVVRPSQIRRLVAREVGTGNVVLPSEWFTTSELDAFRSVTTGRADVAGYAIDPDVRFDNTNEFHTVAYATTSFFPLTGVRPALGRFFEAGENQFGAPTNVAILNYAYWLRAYGGDRTVIGRTLQIDSTLFTIIGVAQRGFDGVDLGAVDAWVPLASLPVGPEGPWWDGRFRVLRLFARVADPREVGVVHARLQSMYANLRSRDPGLTADGFRGGLELESLIQGRTSIGIGPQDARNIALLSRLAVVSLLVLIISICNAASLLLMRALRRRREIAVRLALGVSRSRLLAQLVGESLVLAGVAGPLALWLAFATGRLLRVQLLADVHWSATVIDTRVVILTAAMSLLAGVSAGVAPVIVVRARDVMSSLKGGAAESGRQRSVARVALLATQTGLCMVMLSAAGLFVDSLWHARQFDFGFDEAQLLTVNLPLADENEIARIVEQIRSLPSVEGVARSEMDPRGAGTLPVRLPNGFETPRLDSPQFNHIDTGYARVAGLHLIEGRAWRVSDNGDSVALINRAMAERYWRGRSPLGDCFTPLYGPRPRACFRIIGVVQDVRWNLDRPAAAEFDIVSVHWRRLWMPTATVRTHGPATIATRAAIEALLRTIRVPAAYPPTARLVSDRLEPQIHPWRVAAVLFLAFGLLGLVAATAGIYGLVGYEVTQRTHEFGVRITLGATTQSILRLVITSGVKVTLFGLAVGLIASLAVGRAISTLVFEISPYDPLVLSATMIGLAIAAVIASLIPAWRAAQVDPALALRTE
jgi:putative ABC transport system permease protein